MKAKLPLTKFRNEFVSIRHGNYYDFINLVKGVIPFIVEYKDGRITTGNSIQKDDCDFGSLLKAGPSLLLFYENCKKIYGNINDEDINDEIYGKVVLFEIGLRMHANNNKLLDEKEDLVNVIKKLCKFKDFSEIEISNLHKGRIFLNMIKHNKNQFPSWSSGIIAFEDAYEVVIRNHLSVI